MKVICQRACQVKNHGVVRPGAEIDLGPHEIDARIALYFTDENGKKLAVGEARAKSAELIPLPPEERAQAEEAQLVASTAKQMNKEQLIAALSMTVGATYDAKMSKEDLARALLRAKGVIKS